MPYTLRVTAIPDAGGFRPDTFDHVLQREIELPPLNPTYRHTLIAAEVADDGTSAQLVVRSDPPEATSLDGGLRLIDGTPPAWVRVVDDAGTVLVEGAYPAPLRAGQDVAVGADHFTVADVSWPGRNPDTGVCSGDVDWQVAKVTPAGQPS